MPSRSSATAPALMGAGRRGYRWAVLVVSLLFLTGCATRASVRQLRTDVTALKAKVEDVDRNLAQTISSARDTATGLVRQVREVEGLGQRLGRLEERLQGIETSIKDVKGTVDTLTGQIAKLVERPAARAPEAESVDRLYASALSHYQSGNLGQAVLEFTDLIAAFPGHPMAENAQFWIGSAYFAQQDFRQALRELSKVVQNYPRGNKVADALYRIGLSHRSLFEVERAREVWGRLIREFPESEAARLARTAMGARAHPRPK